MTSKTHTICGFGAAVCAGASLHMDSLNLVILGSAAFFGALIPDLDHPKASINQKILPFKNKITLQIVFILTGLFVIFNGQTPLKLLGAFLILTAISAHRKFTHSLAGVLIFASICSFALCTVNGYVRNAVLGVVIGYVAHLLTDSFSNHGIELLWPFYGKRFGIGVVTTGGISEFLFLGVWIASVALVYNYFVGFGLR